MEIGGGGEAGFFEPEESGAGGEAMGEDHYAIVGEGSFVGEIVHSGEGLADFGEVRGGGIGGVGIGGELFAVVIIAVDGDTEEVWVGEEEIDDVGVGVEMIPGDESDRGVEGDAVHFGDELGEVESAVGLGEGGIVDGEIGEEGWGEEAVGGGGIEEEKEEGKERAEVGGDEERGGGGDGGEELGEEIAGGGGELDSQEGWGEEVWGRAEGGEGVGGGV